VIERNPLGDLRMNISVGSKVVGNWGAMYPTSEGVIVTLEEDGGVEIVWDNLYDGEVDFTRIENIRPKGWRSANGSPIGVFLDEEE